MFLKKDSNWAFQKKICFALIWPLQFDSGEYLQRGCSPVFWEQLDVEWEERGKRKVKTKDKTCRTTET